jgi:hypothetical protein
LGNFPEEEKESVKLFLMELIASLKEAGVVGLCRMCLTCENFVRNHNPDSATPHYCTLIGRAISERELKIGCEQYVAREIISGSQTGDTGRRKT